MASVLEHFLDGYRIAWEERDSDALVKLFTTDAEYRDDPYQRGHQGSDGIREYWTTTTSTQADISVRWGNVTITAGNLATLEWWANLTNEGKPVTLAGSMFLRFAENGLCQELREYWHLTEGAHSPPAGWGE